MNIKIDERAHRRTPTILQRITHTVGAMFSGIIFLQVMLFALFPFSIAPISIVLYIEHPLFIAFVLGCGLAGWIFGREFIDYLLGKSSSWWDLWRQF